ncbi:MAG TPA: hypothetical protein VGD72_03695 [Mycobacteriales bacterium]|jgi:hypothetical protein
MSRAWLVRGGRYGENEMLALDAGLIALGWPELHDLGRVSTLDDLRDLVRRTCPDAPPGRLRSYVRQLWARISGTRQDLRYTLGAGMTVCEVTRHRGTARLAVRAASGTDPGA